MGKYRSKEILDIQSYKPGLEDGFMYAVQNGKTVKAETFEEAQAQLNVLLKQDNVQLNDSAAYKGYYFMPFVWSRPKYDNDITPRFMLECWPTSYIITDKWEHRSVIDVRSLQTLYEKVGD